MTISGVGRWADELDTPALVVDLDALDRNIAVITRALGEHGVGWRPHAKAHKSPAVAHRLLAAGAHGITCAKLAEAEVYAASGVRDILVANQVVGPVKTRRLVHLAAEADVIVAVDSLVNAREISDAAVAAGTRPRVVLELDCGMQRAGVAPGGAALTLAQDVAALPGVRFAGLMAWEGHVLGIRDPAERDAAIRAAIGSVTETADAIRDAGIPVDIVSCGGTGTFTTTGTLPGVTEVQAGGGIFGDAFYRGLGVPVEAALGIVVTVTSRPTSHRIIVDAGRKTVDPSNSPPVVAGRDDVARIALSAEHGTIELAEASVSPAVGDRLLLHVGYSDQCVHLHEALHAVRAGTVVAIWPTLARGKLT